LRSRFELASAGETEERTLAVNEKQKNILKMIKSSCLYKVIFLFVLYLFSVTQFSSLGYAQNPTGPVSSALGGAGIAANDEGEQILHNPGVLAHAKDLVLGAFFSDGYRGENEHDKFIGGTITDNTSESGIAGGFSFFKRRRTFNAAPTLDEIYGQISLAKPIYKFLSGGITFDHLRQQEVGGEKYTQTDITLGFLLNPTPELGVGFVAKNLLGRDEDVPAYLQLKDELGVGVNYLFMKTFRGRLDIVRQTESNPDSKMVFKGGLESFVDAFLVLRMGYQANELEDRNYYSLGFGFTGPRLKIDYSYVQTEDFSGGAMHSVDFRLPF
jgi:hypothetical protein